MKISMDKVASYYNNVQNKNKPEVKGNISQTTGRNFDEILIQTSSRKVEESQFVDNISQKVLAGVTSKTSEDKIQMLKKQVQEGQYSINPGLIASRILLQEDSLNG